jgi:hypothetical protein
MNWPGLQTHIGCLALTPPWWHEAGFVVGQMARVMPCGLRLPGSSVAKFLPALDP